MRTASGTGPYPRTVRGLAFSILFVSILALFTNFVAPRQMDFISFWAAGKLALAGNPLAAYDIETHEAVQGTMTQIGGTMPFAYPPPFLLLVSPFAFLPYGLSAIAWLIGTFTLLVLAVRRVSPEAGWLPAAFPPVLVNGIIGQNGLFTGAIFISGISLIENRPLRAGLLLGCLVIKPQLGVLLPLAFVAGGHWRAFIGAAASSAGLLLLALLLFGSQSYWAFAGLMPLFSSIAADGLVGWHKMASVYASLRLAGASATVAWGVHFVIGLASTLFVWTTWRSKAEFGAKAALLAAATTLITPYIYLYDTVLLLIPFLWLIREGEDPRLLAALWCIPLIVVVQNWGFQLLNPAPLLPILLLLLVWRRLRQTRATGAEHPRCTGVGINFRGHCPERAGP